MKKISSLILIITATLVFTGCGKNVRPPIYKWNNYVKTSTAYGTHSDNKEVIEKHIAELKRIIQESDHEKRRVAPGLYAELGQILFQTNKKEEAKKYFLLEKKTYPESTVFIDRVISKLYGE